MSKQLRALYGLKWNPFAPELPIEALWATPKIDHFLWRIEHSLVVEGGFAMITGEPGTGKSVTLRLLAERLSRLPEVCVGVLTHPQSHLADFYRELGDIFGVTLTPHNRWHGFKTLRQRWLTHLEQTRLRPILLIDEAQELTPSVLCELRALTSAQFDSRHLLSIVLAGDRRLGDKLRRDELLPLGSRIRARLALEYASADELMAGLKHLLDSAGNTQLMSPALMQTLCEHALGNFRVLTTMAGELLDAAAQREATTLDEKLYLELFAVPQSAPRTVRRAATPAAS